MIRLLHYLIFGHFHKWKIIGQAHVEGDESSWTRYYLQCETCGNIKIKEPWW
jgi:hypothetical protein